MVKQMITRMCLSVFSIAVVGWLPVPLCEFRGVG